MTRKAAKNARSKPARGKTKAVPSKPSRAKSAVTPSAPATPRPRKKRAPQNIDKRPAMLAVLRETGNVSEAARRVGVARGWHYEILNEDPEYRKAVADAFEEAADNLEAEAVRRGVKGVTKPVFQGGRRVGYVQEYSDTLLLALLKGRRRSVFGDKQDVTLTIEKLSQMSDDELTEIAEGRLA